MNKVIQGYPQPEKDQFKVYVRSITYNHALYIVDCLNGVAIQQTDFPFIHHVIDDKSTDGESDVIMQWLNDNCKMDEAIYYDSELSNTIMVSHKTNSSYTIVVDFLKNNMYRNPRKNDLYKPWRQNCSYEALCEGDDYWIDDNKLQKQVDIFEKNPDISLVHTYYATLDERDGKLHKNIEQHEGNIIIQSNFPTIKSKSIIDNNKYMIVTPTVMYRINDWKKVCMKDSFLYGSSYFCMGDTQMYYGLSKVGGVIYLPDLTTIYRYSKGSASRPSKIIDSCRFLFSVGEMRTYASFCWGGSQQEVKYFWEKYALKYYYICISYDRNFKSKIPEKILYLTESNWKILLLRNSFIIRAFIKNTFAFRNFVGQYIRKHK